MASASETKPCANCNEPMPATAQFCPRCGSACDVQAAFQEPRLELSEDVKETRRSAGGVQDKLTPASPPGDDHRMTVCVRCGRRAPFSASTCRHCGATLDRRQRSVARDTSPKDMGVVKWLVPVARSGWAVACGYLALVSVVPSFIVLFFLAAFAVLGELESLKRVGVELAGPVTVSLMIGALFSLLAVVAGAATFWHCYTNPRLGGRGRAVFGILLGFLTFFSNCLFIMLMIWVSAKPQP